MDPQVEVVSAITTCCVTKQDTICHGWAVLCNSIFKRMLHECKMNVSTAAIAARDELMHTPYASEEEYACGSRPQAIKVLLREIRQNLDEDTRAQYTPMVVLLFAVRESCGIPEVRQFASMVLKDLTTTSTSREFDVPSPRYRCTVSEDTIVHANTASFIAADGVVLMVVIANKIFEEVSQNHILSKTDPAKIGALVQCFLVLYNACTHGGSAIVADIKDIDLVVLLMQTITFVNRIDHIDAFMQALALHNPGVVPPVLEERAACDSLLVICYRLLFLLSHDTLLGHEYMRQNACIGKAFAQLRLLSFRQTFRPFPVVGELCCKILHRLCQESSDSTLEVDNRDNVKLLVSVLLQTNEYPDAVESITGLLEQIVSTHRYTSSTIVEERGGIGILQSLLQDAPNFRIVHGPPQSPITHCNVMKILSAVCFDDYRQGNLLARKDIVPSIMYYITIYPDNEEFLRSAACLLQGIAESNHTGKYEDDHGRRALMCEGTEGMMHADSPIAIMLAVIKRRPHDCPVLQAFYSILSNLSGGSPEARSRIVKLDGVQHAIATLTVHYSNEVIVSLVVRLLQQLAADGEFSRYSANVMSTLRFVMDAAGLLLIGIQQTIMDALPAMCDADPAGLDPVLWYTAHKSISSLVLRNMHRYRHHPTISAAACRPILYMFNRHNKTANTAALRLDFKLTAIPQIRHIMHIAQHWDRPMVRRQFQEVLWQFAVDDEERVWVDSVAGREEAVQYMLDKYFRSQLTMFQDIYNLPTTNTKFQDDITDDAFEHWFQGLGERFRE